MTARMFLVMIIAFLFAFSSYSQDKVKGGYRECKVHWYEYKYGKIDTNSKHYKYAYTYNDSGNIIVKLVYGSKDTLMFKDTIIYDKNGNKFDILVYYDKPMECPHIFGQKIKIVVPFQS